MRDDNDYSSDMISVKLRQRVTNAKLERRPYHLEQAVKALAEELIGLTGAESFYRVMGHLAATYAADRDMPPNTESVVACAVEMIVNMPVPDNEPAAFIAARIVSELEDMELINQ